MLNLKEEKESMLMECFTNVSHQKIHLKEPEVLETEYVSSVVKIKVKLIKELNIKI